MKKQRGEKVKKKKFKRGRVIKSIASLDKIIWQGGFILWRGRPMHTGFLQSMPYRTVSGGIRAGIFYTALDQSAEGVREQVRVRRTKNADPR